MNHLYAWLAGLALAGLTLAKVADILKPEWAAAAIVYALRRFPSIEQWVAVHHDELGVLEDKLDKGIHQAIDQAQKDVPHQ